MIEKIRKKLDTRSGIVLIVALGILTLLALIAITFATMMRTEMVSSKNFVDYISAKFTAKSGVERAIASIHEYLSDTTRPARRYSAAEDLSAPWAFGDPARRESYDPGAPLETSLFPSLKIGEETISYGGEPLQIGFSTEIKESYTDGRNIASLKILDCASMIYINGPQQYDSEGRVRPLLPSAILLLNNLADILANERGFTIRNLGERISHLRTTLGRNIWAKEELKPILGASIQERENNFRIIKNYITCHAWVDPNTLNPASIDLTNEQSRSGSNINPTPVYIQPGRGTSSASPEKTLTELLGYLTAPRIPHAATNNLTSIACCGAERGNNNRHYPFGDRETSGGVRNTAYFSEMEDRDFLQPRAPVNINTASEFVLRAVLSSLSGWWLNRERITPTAPGAYEEVRVPEQVASEVARRIVRHREALISSRGYGFSTWREFDTFIDRLDITEGQKWIIRANANPNSRLSKFNPDRIMGLTYDNRSGIRFGSTDKSDLTCNISGSRVISCWTTEFCFSSMGYYEIESVGRVLGPTTSGMRPVIAEQRLTTVVKLYDVYRHTTQRQFETAAVPAGTVGITTYPESKGDVLHANLSRRTTRRGFNVAVYDGQVKVSTSDHPEAVEDISIVSSGLRFDDIAPDEKLACSLHRVPNFREFRGEIGRFPFANSPLQEEPEPDPRPFFHCDYTTTLDARTSPGDFSAFGSAEEDRSLIDLCDQSELFPDGYFAHETRRGPDYDIDQFTYGWGNSIDEYLSYEVAENLCSNVGTVTMWIKPTWSPSDLQRSERGLDSAGKTFFSAGSRQFRWPYWAPNDGLVLAARVNDAGQQVYICAVHGDTSYGNFGTFSDNPASIDVSFSAIHAHWNRFGWAAVPITDSNWEPGTWHHLRMAWQGCTLRLWVNEAQEAWVIRHLHENRPALTGRFFIGNCRYGQDTTNRFPLNADATIDDVRVLNVYEEPGRPPDRFKTGSDSGGISYQAVMPEGHAHVYQAGRLMNVSFTMYTDDNWQIGMRVGTVNTRVPVGEMAGGRFNRDEENTPLGRGYRIQTADGTPIYVGPNDMITYVITMSPRDPVGLRTSPILDDITITIAIEPKQLCAYYE